MTTTDGTVLSRRDCAVLRAVGAGRCTISHDAGATVLIDGVACCDQLVGPRLIKAGLVTAAGPRPAPARLTASGRALIEAA